MEKIEELRIKLEQFKTYFKTEMNSPQAQENDKYCFMCWGQVCGVNTALELIDEIEQGAENA